MYNVLIVGVGGQGSLLASRIIGAVYKKMNLEVKISEVHGMAQRGGSVVTHVRAGEDVASPIIPDGEADVIIAFEALEALRWSHCLKKGGVMVYSTQEISPMTVITGAAEYPADIDAKLDAKDIKTVRVPALSLANEAGSSKAANVVLIGAASEIICKDEAVWEAALSETVPPKFMELNRKAFALGKGSVK